MTHLDLQTLAQRVTAGDDEAATALATELESSLQRMARRALRGPAPTDRVGMMLRAEARSEPEGRLAARLSQRVVNHLRGVAGPRPATHETLLNAGLTV